MVTAIAHAAWPLMERADQLDVLQRRLDEAIRNRTGGLVVVAGEAGVGKSALVNAFVDSVAGHVRVMRGHCDPLFTPRPLGPFLELAEAAGSELLDVVRASRHPYEVAAGLARHIDCSAATVLVVEDAHWADQATLDVLRMLPRQLDGRPAMAIVTYRDDELDRWHPLRLVLGELASAALRVQVQPLSREAVAELARDSGDDPDVLFSVTAGNSFFVTEIISGSGEGVPPSVRDAVLARLSRVGDRGRRLAETVAVNPQSAELWLLEQLDPEGLDELEECAASGLLQYGDGRVWFRHELARQAVELTLDEHRRSRLHHAVLDALAQSPVAASDPARLAHHAYSSRDPAAVLRYAEAAAERAAALGAHIESAEHYRYALRYTDFAAVADRARLFRGRAAQCYLNTDFDEAAEAQRQLIACYRQLGDEVKVADAQRWLAQLVWQTGSLAEAQRLVATATERLELAGGAKALALAHAQASQLLIADERLDDARARAEQSIELARAAGSEWVLLQGRRSIAWADFVAGAPGSEEALHECLQLSNERGWDSESVLTLIVLARTTGRRMLLDLAERYVEEGIEACRSSDIDIWRSYLLGWRSRLELARGRYDDAARTAQICLAKSCPFVRLHAAISLGSVRARRGDPDVWGPLDDALRAAQPRRELQWIVPVAAARAEAALLEGRAERALEETEEAWQLACERESSWTVSLAYWRWAAGAVVDVPELPENPYLLEIAGQPEAAAARWDAMGYPYEAAQARIRSASADVVTEALAALRRLEASPLASRAIARLRELGVRRIPRGARSTTRSHPAGLTAREAEVLMLVAQGMRDRDIAAQLVLSARTVEHHVAAITSKLGSDDRRSAVVRARELGIVG